MPSHFLPPALSLHWERDEHFKILTHPGQILLWSSDRDGSLDFASPSWSSFTGLALNELLGKGWIDALPAMEGGELLDCFRAASARSGGFRQKFHLRRHDGIYCPTIMEAQPRDQGFIGFCLDITPYEHSEFEMNLADQRITDLLQQTRLAALALDEDGRCQYCNTQLLTLLQQPASELIHNPFFARHLAPGSDELLARLYPAGKQAADFPLEFETCLQGPQGGTLLMHWHAISLRHFSGGPSGTLLLGDDITAKRQAEERFLLTHKVFETTDQAMVITDSQARIIAVNGAFSRLTGYGASEALGHNPRILQSGRHTPEFYQAMWQRLDREGHWQGEIWDKRKDGSYYPKFLSISAIKDEGGGISHYCGIFYDITERKRVEEKLDHLAHYDALTDLPNRILLHERLEHAIMEACSDGSKIALFYIDLDHFKAINDTLGHDAGDQLLKEVASRLKSCLRAEDTVARLGGDEFVVMQPQIRDPEAIHRVAHKLLQVLSEPFDLDGNPASVTPSIGISLYPDDHHKLDALLKKADQAMYQVKTSGRGNYLFYQDHP